MTVFVAGATGFTGRAVVQQLCEAGVPVVAHIRPESTQLEVSRQRFEALGAQVDTTPWTDEAMAARLAELQPARVFALMGTTRRRMRAEGGSYDAVDFGLTRMLIDAVVAAGCVERLVYLSSMWVRPGTRNAYLRARANSEAHLMASGLGWTIARPAIITGERDRRRAGEHYGAKLMDGALSAAALLGGGKLRARYRSTNDQRLAAALIRLSADPQWHNKTALGEDLGS